MDRICYFMIVTQYLGTSLPSIDIMILQIIFCNIFDDHIASVKRNLAKMCYCFGWDKQSNKNNISTEDIFSILDIHVYTHLCHPC